MTDSVHKAAPLAVEGSQWSDCGEVAAAPSAAGPAARVLERLEMDVQRHKREIAAGFAKLREEFAPPPKRVGDVAWLAAQAAMNDWTRAQLGGLPSTATLERLMAAQRNALANPTPYMGALWGNAGAALFGNPLANNESRL